MHHVVVVVETEKDGLCVPRRQHCASSNTVVAVQEPGSLCISQPDFILRLVSNTSYENVFFFYSLYIEEGIEIKVAVLYHTSFIKGIVQNKLACLSFMCAYLAPRMPGVVSFRSKFPCQDLAAS